MDGFLNKILSSGRTLLADTKAPKRTKKPLPSVTPTDEDPHKVFVRRTIEEKPKAKEVVEEIKKFIKSEEELV